MNADALDMIYIYGAHRVYTLLLRLFLKFDFIGKNVIVSPSCEISRRAAPYIHLGDGVRLARDVWLNIAFEAPELVKNKPIIKLSEGVFVGRRCFFSGINCIDIGRNVLFGPGVFITDHSHEYDNKEIPIMYQGATEGGEIVIEKGCWFGHNSALVTHKGRQIRIGRNSVIGANAVVTKSFPANSVLVGVPARNAHSRRLK